MKKLLEYDPYLDKSLGEDALMKLKDDKDANIIFARQDYRIKDGISINLERGKSYLYLSANEEFLEKGEEKLKKSIDGVERADQKTEATVIQIVEGERTESEQGLGFLFG